MAVKYRGFTNGKKAAVASLAITLPAGTASGDYAVLLAKTSIASATWETPAGWELVSESTLQTEGGGAKSVAVYVRKLTGATGENLATIKASAAGSLEYGVQVAEVGTYDTTTPIDATNAPWRENPTANPIETTSPGPTTTIAGDLIFAFFAEATGPTAVTSYTKDIEGGNMALWHQLEASSGAQTIAFTKSAKAVTQLFCVAIKATSSSTPVTLSLNAAASTSSASAAPTAKTEVLTAAASGTSSASLSATARTELVLAAASSTSSASAAISATAAVTLALAPASSTSSASAAVTAATRLTLAAASSTSSATLAAHAVTLVTLAAALSTATATALVTVPTRIVLNPASSTSAASLTIGTAVALALEPARSTSTATATISIPPPQAPEPPTTTPIAGHVTVGRTGRLARATGRIATTNSGRARR